MIQSTDGDDEAEAGKEIAGELVVAGGDATEVLHAAESALDDVAGLVGGRIEGMPVHPGDLVGDDGRGAARSEEATQMVDIIGLVPIKLPLGAVAAMSAAAPLMSAT